MIKEPLFHFLLLALLIFAYFGLFPSNDNDQAELREIIIGQHEIQKLRDDWMQSWRRPATDQQLSNLIESAVREEIYYREGLLLGLDKNDSVVRNRMVQKMRFLHSEEIPEPTPADLLSWLKQNASDYSSEPLYSFQQVYLGQNYDVSGAPVLISNLDNGAVKVDEVTKPLSVANSFARASNSLITRKFGSTFADSIASNSQTKSKWIGPVISGFGLHLVRISEVQASMPASLDKPATRQRVENDWRAAQGKALQERIFSRLKQNYTVQILNAE
ncbi:MAG: peptidyl-prolyl cis-trans isomerase C [Arenicella sp.]|jgi:peptidyl-prolyl cis-trans isomerase C